MRDLRPRLVPELAVENLDISLAFYNDTVGFKIMVSTPEHRFAYLDLDGAHLMIEEADGPGERFLIAPLEKPYGRGSNLRIEVSDIDNLYEKLSAAKATLVSTLADQWYRHDDYEVGNRQFVVADPDGYLLRFFKDLGTRKLNNA